MCLQLDPPYSEKVTPFPSFEGELPLRKDHTGKYTTVHRIKRVEKQSNCLVLTFFKEPSYLTLWLGEIEKEVFFPRLGAHIEPLELKHLPRLVLPIFFLRRDIQLVTDVGYILHAADLLRPETLREYLPNYQELFPQYDSMFNFFRRIAEWN